MNPFRYALVDERYPYPVKRRVTGPRDENRNAITLLPPDSYLIMERPGFVRSTSPTIYRTVPPTSAKNKEASSFVILGETINTPVQSRPGSPSGRVSPFRGHGFKSPATTRPNSRAPSPSSSPKKLPPYRKHKPAKSTEKPTIGEAIGLPPKSPMISRPPVPKPSPTGAAEKSEAKEEKTKKEKTDSDVKPPSVAVEEVHTTGDEPKEEKTTTEKPLEPSQGSQKAPKMTKQRLTLTPAIPRDKKPPVSPTPKTKVGNQQLVIKKATKPPIPPKKVMIKSTFKSEENANEKKKSAKEEKANPKITEKTKEEPIEIAGTISKKEKEKENEKEKQKDKKEEKENGKDKEKEPKENQKKVESIKEAEKPGWEVKNVEEKKSESKPEESEKSENQKSDQKPAEEKKPEKLIPCFQPDKCQIAPPTMASPSPIITPTISTPSTTPDLAASSKNSQSIATAPTTVTPSTLTSVSSTLVLSGNLARNKSKAARPPPHGENDPEGQMVKPARKDFVAERSKKDASSEEITSATKLIKAEPEMEVLSPNDLRDSPPVIPPRIPPPNLAWDEGRLPNGDVPNKVETEGKFLRFVSAVWRFLGYVFCCQCLNASKCCRRDPSQSSKPSVFSRLCCCFGKSCKWNPLKRCAGCCKCRCEGKKCGRKTKLHGNSKFRKCCAKGKCSCKGCCDKIKARCLNFRFKINSVCRSLFCLNLMCCQNFLRKFKFCHKFKCCQKSGFCSCCNPNVKREARKLNKKASRFSNSSRDDLDVVLVEHTSLMKAAIPVLPPCLAVFCLILNLFVPGSGTFVSGIFCLCFGKPRFSVKDSSKNRFGSFILNTIIGVAQLFTIVFCLVGWGWSIWWGVIMYKLSRRQRRLKLAEKNQKEAEGSNVNHNHVDVEQG